MGLLVAVHYQYEYEKDRDDWRVTRRAAWIEFQQPVRVP